jgi:tetratricopeptide (TPR) repeat protein
MVSCRHCSTHNSFDSLFCKSCGAAIEADDRTTAQQKVQDLVAEGYRIFNEGRTDEARLIAESTLAEEPNSTSAISLMGMCHERAGELAKALACFERVVELNPDSALDKIKVTHLRQSIAGRALMEEPPRKGRAFLGAAAAMVCVVAIGVAIATNGSADQVASNGEKVVKSAFDTDAFSSQDLKPAEPQKQPEANKPAEAAPDQNQVQSGGSTPQAPRTAPSSGWTFPQSRGPATRALPDVSGGSVLQGDIGKTPVTINVPKDVELRPLPPTKAASNADDPDPKMGSGGVESPAVKPAEDPGVIEITVSKPDQPLGGSTPGPDANGAEALLKTASQQFLLGKYSQAAATYEAALRAGAPAGSTNQRIAQCYANAGNKAAAASAYRRAISAYESAIKSGNASARTLSALESCKQALKVLGG